MASRPAITPTAAATFTGAGGAACPVRRSFQRRVKAKLQERYPLPDWGIDAPWKYGLTLTAAKAIGKEVEHWPGFTGPTALQDYAGLVTRAVLDALEPGLTWLTWLTGITDGISYPGDELVSYISQLALTRPGEVPDTGHYRVLLRNYSWYLFATTRHARAADAYGVDGR
jgi:hypothetical protein